MKIQRVNTVLYRSEQRTSECVPPTQSKTTQAHHAPPLAKTATVVRHSTWHLLVFDMAHKLCPYVTVSHRTPDSEAIYSDLIHLSHSPLSPW